MASPFSDADRASAAQLLADFRARGLKIATAESCTGGMIAGLLTEIPGSSDVVERGFVTYSNEAKMEMLGVASDIIARHGAVSVECAAAMAQGALANSRADIAISVTGVAGPGGGSPEKPVGFVCFGWARRGCAPQSAGVRFGDGARADIRLQALRQALGFAQKALI